LPDAVLAFFVSGQRWNGMASVGEYLQKLRLKICRVCKALPTMKLKVKTGVWAIAIEVG
jgi:hypothetical protein